MRKKKTTRNLIHAGALAIARVQKEEEVVEEEEEEEACIKSRDAGSKVQVKDGLDVTTLRSEIN